MTRLPTIEYIALILLAAIIANVLGLVKFARGQEAIVGSKPYQCPARYCGCDLSLKLFGRVIPKLNLAANWPRTFPRAFPAAGMVAARRGHVFLILAHVRGNQYLVYDPNSGRGLTRQHVRSIAGFIIVNPRG